MLRSIGAILRGHPERKSPDDVAITYGADQTTWSQLQKAGVVQDDLVAITLTNNLTFHEAAVETWKAGATPCILSSRLPGREVADILAVADPKVVIGAVDGGADGGANDDLADKKRSGVTQFRSVNSTLACCSLSPV